MPMQNNNPESMSNQRMSAGKQENKKPVPAAKADQKG
jgi:hypothetical protein